MHPRVHDRQRVVNLTPNSRWVVDRVSVAHRNHRRLPTLMLRVRPVDLNRRRPVTKQQCTQDNWLVKFGSIIATNVHHLPLLVFSSKYTNKHTSHPPSLSSVSCVAVAKSSPSSISAFPSSSIRNSPASHEPPFAS